MNFVVQYHLVVYMLCILIKGEMFMNSNNETRIQSLQQLKKELLKYKSEKNYSIGTNKFTKKMQDIYGLFGSDNSFVFVRQKCVGVGLEILQLGFAVIFDLLYSDMLGDWI